ncbi:hypothetical protein [Pararhodobacter zhoushanensis]|uniref:Uncharacterized protein n=1 Tax=Pararhodobacter zhoushanensis TaxID=2479545 RepID=A0ABT3H0L3_9RHOB|nr:hypothetical protein [Pararhodobacter zhoushanensis]MCW1933321.1 hypothetical protein [Pararhodobacter zhoushanensis]
MDPVTAVYYATICAALSFAAGRLRSGMVRIILGVVIGAIAASLLPDIRGMLGV